MGPLLHLGFDLPWYPVGFKRFPPFQGATRFFIRGAVIYVWMLAVEVRSRAFFQVGRSK